MRRSPEVAVALFRRLSMAIGFLSALCVTHGLALADRPVEPTYVSMEVSSVRFPAANSIDLLLTTSTAFFDDKTSKALHAGDGYRIRLTFDDHGQLAEQRIDRTWGGVRGFFCHPMFDPYDGVEVYVHVRDDGRMFRFSRTGVEAFDRQAFDENTKTWAKPVAVKVPLRSGSFNLNCPNGRWLCVEQGKPPTSVTFYDIENEKEVKDEWLERTILNNFRLADIRRGTWISSEKNFVLFKDGHNDRTEFQLHGFGMQGVTKLIAPPDIHPRALSEAGDGRAAVVFNLKPDVVYSHEIDRRAGDRVVNLKDAKQVRSKALYHAMSNVRYQGESRTIVGVDADHVAVNPTATAFEAKARVVRWNLASGSISETVVPFGERFQLVDRHVVPKEP